MNNFFKRIVTAVIAVAVVFSAVTVPANAMTKKQVNSEITSLKKSIKKNKKKLPSLKKADQQELATYTYIKGQVLCENPLIVSDPNQHLYLHFKGTVNDLRAAMTVDDRNPNAVLAEGYTKISETPFSYGVWTCKETVAATAPHSASDLQAKIDSEQSRLKLLQNSKKELLAIDGVTLAKGESAQLVTHFSYGTQEINTLKWKSSNAKVASVSKDGVVTGKKKGSAVVSAKLSVTGKTYKTVVNVQ